MKCGKIPALKIFKTEIIKPKASIFNTSSKGGHVPNPLHNAFGLAERRESLITNILRILASLFTFSAGPI